MANKSTIKKFQMVEDGDMSADITSSITDITKLDNMGLQIKWDSANAVGVISVQTSINYDPQINSGDWVDLSFSPSLTQPDSDNGVYAISLNQLPYPWLRIKYAFGSGSGTFNAWLSAKVIGG